MIRFLDCQFEDFLDFLITLQIAAPIVEPHNWDVSLSAFSPLVFTFIKGVQYQFLHPKFFSKSHTSSKVDGIPEAENTICRTVLGSVCLTVSLVAQVTRKRHDV